MDGMDKMDGGEARGEVWWHCPASQHCVRCGKVVAQVHLGDGAGNYERVCLGCLTAAEWEEIQARVNCEL